jgi:hypothetical protein
MSAVKKYQLGDYVRMMFTKGDIPAGAIGFVQERNFDEKYITVEFNRYPRTRFSEIEIDEYLTEAGARNSLLGVPVNDDEKVGPFKVGQHLRLVKEFRDMPAGLEATVLSVMFNGDLEVEFSSGWVAKLEETDAVEYFGVTVAPYRKGDLVRLEVDDRDVPAGALGTVSWVSHDHVEVDFKLFRTLGYNSAEASERLLPVFAEVNDDPVNHPKHYNSHPSGIECIQIIEHMSFNVGNAIKYLWRADEKGAPIQDLEKAKWHIEREIQRGKNNVS